MNKKIILLVSLLVLLASLTACKTTSTPPVVDNSDNSMDTNQPVNTDQVATDVTADLIPEDDNVEIGEMI